ncbi:MAG: ABC transporter ATP-binding protein [Defluviitaleaceae bacterium]|nr:ABC transporter ATP-binding protein [Defluviitaleaceae bacterium]MCL2836364.1 ABC transporter ATP-binding protein [Defluviitaleaceae bacterium]
MLEIKNLTKTYKNGKKAVDSLSLTVRAGEIYGFIGHNGAGKTTAMKCVTGILEYETGEIYMKGKSVKDEPLESKHSIAYIPDSPDLYVNMTGIKYLKFIADVCGLDKEKRENGIRKYAGVLELTNSLGDLVSSYSHGMKQKLALISALMREPELLILDEPFVGLDPKAAFTLKEQLKAICGRGGAVFFSTHILDVAEKLCDKIAIIKAGKLVVSGETNKVTGDKSLENLFLELTE